MGASGEQAGAPRGGGGRGGEAVQKSHADLCEAIQVGRVDLLVAVRTEDPLGNIVGDHEHDIRPLGGGFLGGEGRQRQAAEEKMAARKIHGELQV